MTRKVLSMMLSLVMLLSICGAAFAADDMSKKVEITMWMTGKSTPRDFDRVVSELSKKFEQDLNCTLNFNLFNDSNSSQRMTLMLSSGEPIDLIYSANYLGYANFAHRGAYMPLEDLLPEICPDLWNYVSEEFWDAVKVDGHIYMVPCMWPEYVPYGFLWREDLRKKYDLPVPVDFESMEAYMQGIKENCPDMMVTGEQVNTYNPLGTHFTTWELLDGKYRWADYRVPYGLYIDYADPTKVIEWWETDEFREDMKMFKRWADAGFWSKSALATTEAKTDAFQAGKIACDLCFNSPSGYADLVATVGNSHPDWELGWTPFYRMKKLATPNDATQNGFSIPITAEHPERALKVLEMLTLNQDYFRLSQYGIEGEHYTVSEEGFYEYVGDASSSGFPREGSRLWGTRNTEFMLYPQATGRILKELTAEFDTYRYPNIWTGFDEDYTAYQAERAAVMNVQTQYLPAIQAGLVDDVDAAIDDFIQKMYDAGLETVRKGYTEQWLAYVERKGIQKCEIAD